MYEKTKEREKRTMRKETAQGLHPSQIQQQQQNRSSSFALT